METPQTRCLLLRCLGAQGTSNSHYRRRRRSRGGESSCTVAATSRRKRSGSPPDRRGKTWQRGKSSLKLGLSSGRDFFPGGSYIHVIFSLGQNPAQQADFCSSALWSNPAEERPTDLRSNCYTRPRRRATGERSNGVRLRGLRPRLWPCAERAKSRRRRQHRGANQRLFQKYNTWPFAADSYKYTPDLKPSDGDSVSTRGKFRENRAHADGTP